MKKILLLICITLLFTSCVNNKNETNNANNKISTWTIEQKENNKEKIKTNTWKTINTITWETIKTTTWETIKTWNTQKNKENISNWKDILKNNIETKENKFNEKEVEKKLKEEKEVEEALNNLLNSIDKYEN